MDPIQYIICAIIVLVVAVITWFVAIAYRKNVAESKTGKAEDKAREIIDEALKTAEAKKREALLDAKEENLRIKNEFDKEIKELQKALEDTPTNKCCPRGLDLEGIRSTLNSLIDFSGSTISHDVINQFVYMVTPTSDTTFDWYVNLNGTADVKATFTAEGRKKSCIIKLEEIEKISSLHRKENEDNAHLIKNPIVFAFLHRQLLNKSRLSSRQWKTE